MQESVDVVRRQWLSAAGFAVLVAGQALGAEACAAEPEAAESSPDRTREVIGRAVKLADRLRPAADPARTLNGIFGSTRKTPARTRCRETRIQPKVC